MYSCILKFPINTRKSLLHVRSKLQDVVMHFTYFLWLSFLMIEVARGYANTNLVVSNYNSLIFKLGMKFQNRKLRKFNTETDKVVKERKEIQRLQEIFTRIFAFRWIVSFLFLFFIFYTSYYVVWSWIYLDLISRCRKRYNGGLIFRSQCISTKTRKDPVKIDFFCNP